MANNDSYYTIVNPDWSVRRVVNTTTDSRPASEPRRERVVVVESCDVCGASTDSEAHINHCRG